MHGPKKIVQSLSTRCQAYQDVVGMFKVNEYEIDIKEFQINAVHENSKILHQGRIELKKIEIL